jgi:hypothetical protein
MLKMSSSTPIVRRHVNNWLSSWSWEFFTILDILDCSKTHSVFDRLEDIDPVKSVSNELIRLERHHKLAGLSPDKHRRQGRMGRPPKVYKKNMIFRENNC